MSGAMSAAGEVERRIRAYEAMGWHRTGWEGDEAAADWLIAELEAMGVEAREQRFRAPRWEWERAEVHVAGGRIIFGEPLSDGPLKAGVVAPLRSAPDGHTVCIAVWRTEPGQPLPLDNSVYNRLDELRALGAQAVLLVMGDEHGNKILRNAERPWDPIDLPVLQVASADADSLVEGAIGELVIEGRREVVEARNVVGEIAGADGAAAPVALITPKSGWFTCAAERGGGIAVWLAVAERIMGRIAGGERPRRGLRLVASSGHELHHLGLEAYLESLGDGVTEVAVWVHLGASIGAKRGTARLAASDAELMGLAQAALAAAGIEREALAVGRSGYGEARNIAEAGGRYVSLLGGHPYFHSPMDTFERAVDVDLAVRHVDAVESVVRALLA